MEIKKEIGYRLKEIRQSLNLTQFQLAKELNTSQANIAGLENESTAISDKFKDILYKKFNININYLVTGEGSKFIDNERKYLIKIPIIDAKVSSEYGYKSLDNPPISDYFDMVHNPMNVATLSDFMLPLFYYLLFINVVIYKAAT